MRTLILAAAVALTASGASAAEMPKDLHGVWCVVVPGTFQYSQVPEACPDGADTMEVNARGLSVDEHECRLLKLTRFDVYPWGKRPYKNSGEVIKNPWGPAYRMSFRCASETGHPFVVQQRWDREKGVLTISGGAKLPTNYLPHPMPPIYGGPW
jgi:hypothetical protein